MSPLFAPGTFTSHSGLTLHWKIECDALTDEDWAGLARIAVDYLPPFGYAVGIPRGGQKFAEALRQYEDGDSARTLVCDDVCTTGRSFVEFRDQTLRMTNPELVVGVVVFARGPCPDWVTPLFSMPRARA